MLDERRADMTKGMWALQLAAWSLFCAILWLLIARSGTIGFGATIAFAFTTVVAAAYNVARKILATRHLGHWRWPILSASAAFFGLCAHLLLAALGMKQPLFQDAINVNLVVLIALIVQQAWRGRATHQMLVAEKIRRQAVEQRLADPALSANPAPQLTSFKSGRGWLRMDPSHIRYVEAEGNFSAVHLTGRKEFISEPLKEIGLKLKGAGFMRIHRSYLVNAAKIRIRSPTSVELLCGTRLAVGRSYRKIVMTE